jgi:microcystin-dependent protein
MGVLRAKVNGEWVDINVSTSNDEEVAVTTADPGFTYDLWYDPDADAGVPSSGTGAPSTDAGNDVVVGADEGVYFDHDIQYRDHIPKFANAAARDAAITAPVEGQMVYLSDVNQYLQWDGMAWVGISATPTGSMIMFAGAAAPSGWLLCQGQSLLKTDYAGLFAVIGFTYGGTDPNFLLPDMRARSPVGVGSAGLSNTYTLGQKHGEEFHAITVNEMAAHDHTPGTGAANTDHTHYGWANGPLVRSGNVTGLGGLSAGATLDSWPGHTAGFNTNHVHGVNWQGANWGHNTVHPVLGINYIIKV